MKGETPTVYKADNACVDCGKGVSPDQANLSRERTQLSRAFGDSCNRHGFVLCRRCLDKETRPSRAAINGRTKVHR